MERQPERMAFPHLSVTVDSVEADRVLVLDSFRVARTLTKQNRAGREPRVGERWSIVQSMGRWTLDVLIQTAVDERSWQPLALDNGWVGTVEYRVHGGLTLLAGMVSHPSLVRSVAFTLPAGARPGRSLVLLGAVGPLSTEAAPVQVATSGEVVLARRDTYLDGLSFLAEA